MGKKAWTVAKILLIGCGSVIALVLLFFIGIGVYMAYGSHKADEAAKAFCATVHVGDEFDAVAAAAAKSAYPNRMMSPEDGQRWFSFQGGMFHAAMCKLTIQDGKVTSAKFSVDDY